MSLTVGLSQKAPPSEGGISVQSQSNLYDILCVDSMIRFDRLKMHRKFIIDDCPYRRDSSSLLNRGVIVKTDVTGL